MFYFTLTLILLPEHNVLLNGTVSVMLTDPPCKKM